MTGVYCIICLKNRKIYVGQSVNITKRFRHHKYMLKKGTHNNKTLQKAWNKYGEEMFKFFVIEETNEKQVHKRELWWIKTLQPYNPSIGFNKNWNGK